MNIRMYNQIIGENPPDLLSPDVKQNYDDTCAIKSQQLILEDFGIHVTEEQLIQKAEELGIYTPGGGGTLPEDLGRLLEANGVQCTQHLNATVFDLTSALAKGQKVIIGVDSGELWGEDIPTEDQVTGEQPDHALVVAGIDTSDPNNVQVILTDPGTGEEGVRYPLEQFLDAWHDSNNYMVTTDLPMPLIYNPEMVNFDYDSGHIPAIGQIPYDYFNENILPTLHSIPTDLDCYDMFYNDFNQMLDADIMSFSPEFVNAVQNHNGFIPDPNLDFTKSFEPYRYDDSVPENDIMHDSNNLIDNNTSIHENMDNDPSDFDIDEITNNYEGI